MSDDPKVHVEHLNPLNDPATNALYMGLDPITGAELPGDDPRIQVARDTVTQWYEEAYDTERDLVQEPEEDALLRKANVVMDQYALNDPASYELERGVVPMNLEEYAQSSTPADKRTHAIAKQIIDVTTSRAYLDPDHEDHEAVVAHVTALFQQIYG